MINKIEYFNINDNSNVLAIEHHSKKIKGKKNTKTVLFYEIVNKKSIQNRKRLSNKKIELSKQRYKNILEGKTNNNRINVYNDISQSNIKINTSLMNNLINEYDVNLKLANRSFYPLKTPTKRNSNRKLTLKPTPISDTRKYNIQIGGDSDLELIEDLVKNYLSYFDPYNSFNGCGNEIQTLLEIFKLSEKEHIFEITHNNNEIINSFLILIQVKIIKSNLIKNKTNTLIKNKTNTTIIAKQLFKYTKFFLSLFRNGFLYYEFTNNQPQPLKFLKNKYLFSFCRNFSEKKNENKIKALIYFIIHKNIKLYNYYDIDACLFSFHLHMYCYKFLNIISFTDEDLFDKYSKLFIVCKTKKTELDNLKESCKEDELINNDDFMSRMKYLLDLENEESGNIFTFKTNNAVSLKDKNLLIKTYQKFNLSCTFSYFKIEDTEGYNYIYFVRVF